MAEKFDAASRLAEGRPAVDDIQNYVWACHLLGYQNPDLTLHAAQVRDWYGSEDGLDLRALDNDCAALDAAVSAVSDALARQDDQLAAVSAAWQGHGADASRSFLRDHQDSSAVAATAVRTAADALAELRDNLWGVVDGKVATTMAVGQRAQAEWLAAAQTVASGAGDRATASELIDQQVKPFVDNDIRADWLTAMRSATAAVMDSYDAATTELTTVRDAMFGVPGDLGPSWTPPLRDDDIATTTPAAAQIPAAGAPSWSAPPWSAPVAAPAMPAMPAMPAAVDPMPAPTPPPADPAGTTPAMAALPTMPSMPSLGGLPDIGSGLSGLGQQLGDVFGSLLGNADDTLANPAGLDDPGLDAPQLDDNKKDDEPVDGTDEKNADDETAAEEPVVDPAVDACPAAEPPPPVEEPSSVEPAPTPIPPPPDAVAAPEPAPDPVADQTPCEIAADELPQVGE
ncbi:hypothetical protein [Mycobacterium sp. MMS18-G62]